MCQAVYGRLQLNLCRSAYATDTPAKCGPGAGPETGRPPAPERRHTAGLDGCAPRKAENGRKLVGHFGQGSQAAPAAGLSLGGLVQTQAAKPFPDPQLAGAAGPT